MNVFLVQCKKKKKGGAQFICAHVQSHWQIIADRAKGWTQYSVLRSCFQPVIAVIVTLSDDDRERERENYVRPGRS